MVLCSDLIPNNLYLITFSMDDQELLKTSETELADTSGAGEYLQEAGDTVSQMLNKFKMTVQQQAVSELKPSELAEINAKQKFEFLNREIGGMITRGDVGAVASDSKTGTPLQGDMDFLAEKGLIPEELREETETK